MYETKFKSRNVRTVRYGIETASFVHQDCGTAFPKSTKNIILLTNLKQKLSFVIQKTAHASFAKIIYNKAYFRLCYVKVDIN